MDNQRRRLFMGCFIALIATAFGFAVRGAIMGDWRTQFGLTEEEVGMINLGAGLFPFAISIILFSLIVDKIGYGTSMIFAFAGHMLSTVLTIFADSFITLYIATFIFALANGIVEAVINPVVATVYAKNKTHWLNVLHAGWPGGLVLGGLLGIGVLFTGGAIGARLPGHIWQWQMAIVLIPTVIYGIVLLGVKFPAQERVEAGVSYMDMLREFGWGSAYIVCFLLVMAVSQILRVFDVPTIEMHWALAIALIPTIPFALVVRSFGRPMFVFLMLVMFLLATTELGTDGWIQDIMASVLANKTMGILFLVYTSVIMFILRFFAGPIVHRISPLGLLASCAAIATAGLVWLGNAGSAIGILFLAATLYGIGKTFFWPTTLGVVSEQYPRGGALMLNAIAGVGMIAVGTIGGPGIGTLQDVTLTSRLAEQYPQIQSAVTAEKQGLFFDYQAVDSELRKALPPEQEAELSQVERATKQNALAYIAILPAIMFVCYLGLIVYYQNKGGYKAEVLTGHAAEDEKFTGGVEGPVE